jgi:hydroxymethylpyrimidine pyrophosphatase-like HAD family hydrolase
MSNKLIVSDFDFSFFAKQISGVLSAEEADKINRQLAISIKEFQSKGGIVSLCSGNDFETINQICKKYGWIPNFISSKCGTVLHQFRVIYSENENFSAKMQENFNWQVILEGVRSFSYGRGHTFIKHLPSKNGEGKSSGWLAMELLDEHFLHEIQKFLDNQGWLSKVSWSPIKEVDQIQAFQTLGFDAGLVKNLDVLHRESGKGGALSFLANLLQPEEILVMGDSGNDAELFAPVNNWNGKQPTCILPLNVGEELKNAADKSRTIFSSYPCGAALIEYLELF